MTQDANREFQFSYRFGGHEWGATVFANDPAEAREKIKAVGMARYQGEVAMKIPVPGGSGVLKFLKWWRSR